MVYTSIYKYIPLRTGNITTGFRGAHCDAAPREVAQPSLTSSSDPLAEHDERDSNACPEDEEFF